MRIYIFVFNCLFNLDGLCAWLRKLYKHEKNIIKKIFIKMKMNCSFLINISFLVKKNYFCVIFFFAKYIFSVFKFANQEGLIRHH